MNGCPFCQIVAGRTAAALVREWPAAIAIVPLNPVAPGHTLVLPRRHIRDFTDPAPDVAATMVAASELARDLGGSMNLITSRGVEATQTVFHLHLHLVPRRAGDGLPLPWADHLAPHPVRDLVGNGLGRAGRPFSEWMERVNTILTRRGLRADDLEETRFWEMAHEDGFTPMAAVRDAER